MGNRIKFKVVIQHSDKAVKAVSKILEDNEFKVYDLRQSDIVMDSDNSFVNKVYLLYCVGTMEDYSTFKQKHDYTEITHEDCLTLV